MGFSDNLAGAGLTVAIPLALLATIVLWGFFGRHPNTTFGGVTKTSSEPVGRPDIQTSHTHPQTPPSSIRPPGEIDPS